MICFDTAHDHPTVSQSGTAKSDHLLLICCWYAADTRTSSHALQPSTASQTPAAPACSDSSGVTVQVDNVAAEPAKYSSDDGRARALQICPSATACSHTAASFITRHKVDTLNGLVLAVVLAFKGHHSLELTPDAIFNTIMGGMSAHVHADPEKFRSSFVSHDGKKTLKVYDDSLSTAWSSRWERAVAQLGDLVLENFSNPDAQKAFSTKFSTTGSQEAAAHTMTFMDVVKDYFEYIVITRCGIPWIDISGCKEDWESLAAAIDPFLIQLGLGTWNMQLQNILSHFIKAFDPEAKQDRQFWSGILKYNGPHGSGGEATVTGWLAELFPYIQGGISPAVTISGSPAAQVPPGHHHLGFGCWDRAEAANAAARPLIRLSAFPTGITSTPFIWDFLGTEYKMQLQAGIIGVSVNEAGSLKPEVGWLVAYDN